MNPDNDSKKSYPGGSKKIGASVKQDTGFLEDTQPRASLPTAPVPKKRVSGHVYDESPMPGGDDGPLAKLNLMQRAAKHTAQ